jgi:hypothetical protein
MFPCRAIRRFFRRRADRRNLRDEAGEFKTVGNLIRHNYRGAVYLVKGRVWVTSNWFEDNGDTQMMMVSDSKLQMEGNLITV